MPLTDKGKKKVEKGLKGHARKAIVFTAGRLINEILNATPAETPGRMQAAWINAFQKLDVFGTEKEKQKALGHIMANHKGETADEGDKSWQYGWADEMESGLAVTVKLANRLDFASTVEFGGVIEVGDPQGNRGNKKVKVFPGQLDGPRHSGSSGVLRWVDESGTTRISKQRNMNGAHSIQKSIPKAKRIAKKFGFQ